MTSELPQPTPAYVRPDGRGVWVYPLTFGRARIVLGEIGSACLDAGW